MFERFLYIKCLKDFLKSYIYNIKITIIKTCLKLFCPVNLKARFNTFNFIIKNNHFLTGQQ